MTNPISGRGRGRRAHEFILRRLGSEGIAAIACVTGGPGQGAAFLRSLAQPIDGVFGLGGDGTVHELVGVLAGTAVPLAIVPLGTGNVLAKEHGIPRNPAGAVSSLLGGGVRQVDLGRANGQLFHAMVTAGIDAAVVHRLERRRTGPMPMTAYVPAAVRTVFSMRPVRMTVEVDGERLGEPASYVAVANTRAYGGPITVAADARSDDGLLDVVALPFRCHRRLALFFVRALNGGVSRSAFAVCRRGRHVSVAAEEPVPVQCDGEAMGFTPLQVEIVPGAVALVVPCR
ncbi:MAG: diacylglycerol kinase family protein [Planctomycetota bacterium]